MGPLRKPLGAGLWSIAAVIGLVGLLLCVTIILLPLGIPLVMLAGRLITRSVQLMLPRMLAHPVDELTKMTKKRSRRVGSAAQEAVCNSAKTGCNTAKTGREFARKHSKLSRGRTAGWPPTTRRSSWTPWQPRKSWLAPPR